MTTRRTHNLIWWLLPLFALRSLVPAGFMLDTSHGSVSMIICTGGTHHAAMLAEQSKHSLRGQHDSQSQHGDSICPFAVAATSAPAPSVLPMVVGAASVIDTAIVDVVGLHPPFGPSRVQQSRAPPHFS